MYKKQAGILNLMGWHLLSRLMGGGGSGGSGAYVFKSDGYHTTRDGETDIGWAPTTDALAKQVYAAGVRAKDVRNLVEAPEYVQGAVRKRCPAAAGLRVGEVGNLRKDLEDLAKGGAGEKRGGEPKQSVDVRGKPKEKK